jgi:hypothetical protein
MIVCLSGWKRSGKDTAADLLVSDFNFKRVAFADSLKDMVAEQYGISRKSLDDQSLKESPIFKLPVDPKDPFSKMITDYMNPEFRSDAEGKLYWTPRALAILEGSVKRSVNSKYWTSRALSQIGPSDLAVVTDLRYKSEAAQVREYADTMGVKSLIIRINRFDTSPSQDPSERDMDDFLDFDTVIENRGTIQEFEEKLSSFIFSKL